MRRLWMAFLSIGLAAGGCAGDPATERAKLQGRWRAVSAEQNGVPTPELVGHELAFTGDRFRITRGGNLLYGGAYTVDPSAWPPRIDFRQEEGATLRGIWRGIYRFDGSSLEIADNALDTSKPAPARFATAPASGHVLVRFVPR